MNANRLTVLLAAELAVLPVGPDCCRRAEAAALVQTGTAPAGTAPAGTALAGGGLADPAAGRLAILYGQLPWSRLHAVLGLRDRAGRLRVGLPAMLIARAGPCCLTAIVRGAVLAGGSLRPRPGRLSLYIGFRDVPTAVAVTGATARLGIAGRLHADGDGERLHLPDAVGLLTLLPALDTLTAWRHGQSPAGLPRQSRQQANARRAATAATATVTRLRELVEGRYPIPDDLAPVARLRLRHPQASLAELGALADPPLTKDTVAGRLRRLLQLHT